MRFLGCLLLCLCALGCRRSKPPLRDNVPRAVKPVPADQRAPQCASDRDCARLPSSPGETLLCEQGRCQAFDSKLALRWAHAQLGELASYRADENPKLSDAPWYAEGRAQTLYVRNDWLEAKPRAAFCVGITLQAHEGRLFADLDARGHSAVQSPCSLRLSLGSAVRLWDNRCQGGTPAASGGEERIPFDRLLTRADARGLVYASLPVQLAPACQYASVERAGCEPARCDVCTGYYLQTAIDYGGTHVASVPKNSEREQLPGSCGPCLPDPRAAQVPRLAAIFARHRFTQTLPDGATFHISQRDCELALKK